MSLLEKVVLNQEKNIVEKVVTGVDEVLEKRSYEQGNITSSSMANHCNDAIVAAFEKHGIINMLQYYNNQACNLEPEVSTSNDDVSSNVFMWGGVFISFLMTGNHHMQMF